jgi:hypothetical protein
MKRTAFGLILGLILGLGAHLAWFGARAPDPVSDLDSQLAWMKRDFLLDDAQLARIRALHEQARPRLLELAREVGRMRREFAAFEEARLTAGRVDYVKFSRFVVQQRALDHECLDTARQLVAATAEILTPVQRDQYLTLLIPAIQGAAAGSLN